jgi:hypothetical protein
MASPIPGGMIPVSILQNASFSGSVQEQRGIIAQHAQA